MSILTPLFLVTCRLPEKKRDVFLTRMRNVSDDRQERTRQSILTRSCVGHGGVVV